MAQKGQSSFVEVIVRGNGKLEIARGREFQGRQPDFRSSPRAMAELIQTGILLDCLFIAI